MAQRFTLNKAPYKTYMIIGDDELVVYEFQDFWSKVERETGITIDTYSGQRIKLEVNRKLALLITNQLYKIEEVFPESKVSIYNLHRQLSKKVVTRFFKDFLILLDEAYSQNLLIIIEGE